MLNEEDYFDIGLACADVSTALKRGINGKQLDELSQSVLEAIDKLTACVGPATRVPSILLTNVSVIGL